MPAQPPILEDLGGTYLFNPPTVREPAGLRSRLLRFYTRERGLAVLKTGSDYLTIDAPTQDQVTAADVAYLGGRSYTVNYAEAFALSAAGYYNITPIT